MTAQRPKAATFLFNLLWVGCVVVGIAANVDLRGDPVFRIAGVGLLVVGLVMLLRTAPREHTPSKHMAVAVALTILNGASVLFGGLLVWLTAQLLSTRGEGGLARLALLLWMGGGLVVMVVLLVGTILLFRKAKESLSLRYRIFLLVLILTALVLDVFPVVLFLPVAEPLVHWLGGA